MSNTVGDFFSAAENSDGPLSTLIDFLAEEEKNETAGNYDQLRFVGYVLELGLTTLR